MLTFQGDLNAHIRKTVDFKRRWVNDLTLKVISA